MKTDYVFLNIYKVFRSGPKEAQKGFINSVPLIIDGTMKQTI